MRQIPLILLVISVLMPACNPPVADQASKEDRFIDSLLSEMTLEEKIGQMTLLTSGWDVTGPVLNDNYRALVKSGACGNIFNAHTVKYNRELQRLAVEETRLHIPLLFGYDIIHGHKTIFPIPLGEACSWDLNLIKESAHYSAEEGAASGLNWTFNPMVDITRDPRWGRVAEGSGEDTWLGCQIAKAKVEGYQGDDLSDPLTLAACVKHFAAYGAPEAGRDYNTVDMSERVLREVYLPPYKAAVDAGVASVMTSFNEYDAMPATGNKFLLTTILRDEWGFKGVVVTDYTAINEMVKHGVAANDKQAGALALNAGVDMDMQGSVYLDYLKQLLDEGKVNMQQINQAVKRILKMKYDLGLFADPYRYLNEDREKKVLFSDEIMEHALKSAERSMVLLRNEPFNGEKILPLSKNVKNIAVIGPLGDDQIDMLGTWHAAGDASRAVTVLQGLRNKLPDASISYARGCDFTGDSKKGFAEALQLARKADIVIMAIGENYMESGEAASRSQIGLPGVQQDLVKAVMSTGKPVVALVMAGRPLTITWMAMHVPAIINTWHLGTRAGDAIASVLTGDYNPSGKLTMTFPRNTGQIPIYYNHKNTGRPFEADNKYTSKYLDVSNEPLYPFGYGLSYTSFSYSPLSLDKDSINMNDSLRVSVTVTNTGKYAGEEVIQLYTHDVVASVTRPVKELKGFKKIMLQPGEKKKVTFVIHPEQLSFLDANLHRTVEPGIFEVFAGTNSNELQKASFKLLAK